jgi:hypothetical protein
VWEFDPIAIGSPLGYAKSFGKTEAFLFMASVYILFSEKLNRFAPKAAKK